MGNPSPEIDVKVILEVDLGSSIGQCRAMPVSLGRNRPGGMLVVYCADFDVDPWTEMFFYPTDTLKMALLDASGAIVWRKDLGRGIVPGIWFCPVCAFDLDSDGVDEIWFVNNSKPDHPISIVGSRLQRLDAFTGEATGDWPWCTENQKLGINAHRHFIGGGYVRGEPVLFTATGTYGDMHLFGWNPGMESRWKYSISANAPGARGSHMLTFVDIDNDGADEVIWGERAVSMDTGIELFCADRNSYKGHSDINQPFLDHSTDTWYLYTCREQDQNATPRVVCFDHKGNRIWGAVDYGHMDMGWVARIGDGHRMVASAIRVNGKTCGSEGRNHTGIDEFLFDALTGEPVDFAFSTYRTIPVDINGDGYHELVRGQASGNGELLDRHGKLIANLGAPVAMASKFTNLPGEQLLCYYPDGKIRVWADRNAQDTDAAKARYAHPFYTTNRRITGAGYNLMSLGGI